MSTVWPKYCFWQQLQVKAVVELIRTLVIITYKHVSFCYTAANLATIATTFLWTHPFFQRIEFRSNQIATQFTGATKRPHVIQTGKTLLKYLLLISCSYYISFQLWLSSNFSIYSFLSILRSLTYIWHWSIYLSLMFR